MTNTQSKRPAAKPVIEPIVEPVIEPEQVEQPEPEPVFKPVMVKVKALGWYNNGNLIDKPWMPGEVRKIDLALFKRIKNDLPGNWETV